MLKNTTRLKIALQKSGRLGDESLELLKKSGFHIRMNDRMLQAFDPYFPLEILFLRAGDIAEILADGIADIGILGQNSLYEKERGKELEEIQTLGFGDCRLCLAAPKSSEINSLKDFEGKVIATSHELILKNFLSEKNISAEVVPMSGSVEIAPALQIADVICDLVSSGSTLAANNLREVETIFVSEATLTKRKNLDTKKEKHLEEFLLRINSVLNARKLKSVTMNAPESALEKIQDALPALSSPTVSPLAKEGWIAIHTIITEDENFWVKIKNLKNAGASGILISPVERVIL